jgi:hypothetical protein
MGYLQQLHQLPTKQTMSEVPKHASREPDDKSMVHFCLLPFGPSLTGIQREFDASLNSNSAAQSEEHKRVQNNTKEGSKQYL